MTSTREQIMTAFCDKIFALANFPNTGRRVPPLSKAGEQPGCYVRNLKDEYQRRPQLPPKVTLHVEIWIYSRGGQNPDAVPGSDLNNLVDAIDACLVPVDRDAALGRQTLGNRVEHCWIEGDVLYYSGDLTSQSIALVPIRILVP